MKTPFLIDLLDLYGKQISLQIFGESKKKSLFGAMMGVLSLISIGAITVYFLITLFSRDTKQIITSQSTVLIPLNDLSKMPFLIGMGDPSGIPILPSAGIYEVTALYEVSSWNNGNYGGRKSTPIELRPCTRQDAPGWPLTDAMLAVGLCIPYGKYNLTLNSYPNDFNNGWTRLKFNFARCDPQKNKCQNDSVINNVIEKGVFYVNTATYLTDNQNNNSPFKVLSQGNKVLTSTSLYKLMNVYYDQNLYTDDYGFVFESLVTYNFFTQGQVNTDVSLITPGTATSNLIASVDIQNSAYVVTTKRTFLKAQAILANIGGVMKFIMVCAQVITQFVIRKNVFIQIGNEVYDYTNKNVAMKRKFRNENNAVPLEERLDNVLSNAETKQREEIGNSPAESLKKFNRNLR